MSRDTSSFICVNINAISDLAFIRCCKLNLKNNIKFIPSNTFNGVMSSYGFATVVLLVLPIIGVVLGCNDTGNKCAHDTDCCSNVCNYGNCAPCRWHGQCKKDSDCCSKKCTGGTCDECNWQGKCKANDECCSNNCNFGRCTTCKWWGKCIQSDECCTQNCLNRYCSIYPVIPTSSTTTTTTTTTPRPCIPEKQPCVKDSQCCSKVCLKHNCQSRSVDPPKIKCGAEGSKCNRNADCCDFSKYCVPYYYYKTNIAHKCTSKCQKNRKMCDSDEQCCDGFKCYGGRCKPTTCLDLEETCSKDDDCCLGPCAEGQCVDCTPEKQYCTRTAECCGRMCCVAFVCQPPSNVHKIEIRD